MQSKRGPSVVQPYRDPAKLLRKGSDQRARLVDLPRRAVLGSIWDSGHAGGPLVAGGLVAWLGYGAAFAIIAAAMAVTLLAFLTVLARTRYPSRG